MPVVIPKVVTEVAKYLRELSAAEADPRDWIARVAGPSLLEIADLLEANQDPTGQAYQVLRAQYDGLLALRERASQDSTREEEVKRIDELLPRIGNWMSDLNAMSEPMTD